jgi:hypothetical protein
MTALDPRGAGAPHDPERPVMLVDLELLLRTLARLRAEEGFTTAELLGNAALGIAALVAIWALLTNLGTSVISFMRSAIGVGG